MSIILFNEGFTRTNEHQMFFQERLPLMCSHQITILNAKARHLIVTVEPPPDDTNMRLPDGNDPLIKEKSNKASYIYYWIPLLSRVLFGGCGHILSLCLWISIHFLTSDINN